MSPPTEQMTRAREQGKQAARTGGLYRDNPYRDQDGPKLRVLARLWDSGFGSEDPMSVDYDD